MIQWEFIRKHANHGAGQCVDLTPREIVVHSGARCPPLLRTSCRVVRSAEPCDQLAVDVGRGGQSDAMREHGVEAARLFETT